MDNLNTAKPEEDASIFNARWLRPMSPGAPPGPRRGLAGFTGAAFTEMMLTDLIPMLAKTYRVLPGRKNRAMTGLSMGGMQTFLTTLANLDKVRLHRRLQRQHRRLQSTFDPKTSNNGVFADAAAFDKKIKVLFLDVSSEVALTSSFSDQPLR